MTDAEIWQSYHKEIQFRWHPDAVAAKRWQVKDLHQCSIFADPSSYELQLKVIPPKRREYKPRPATTKAEMSPQLPPLDPAELTPAMNIRVIQAPHQLQRLREFLDTTDTFSLDVETNVADRFTERVMRTVQIGNRDEQFVIDLLAFAGSTEALCQQKHYNAPAWADPIRSVIEPALAGNTHVKVGANLAFEYITFRWCWGTKIWHLYDVQLAEKCLHCGALPFNRAGNYALDDIVARYFKRVLSKTEQKGFHLEGELTESQVMYAALDARVPTSLMSLQAPLLAKNGLERAVKIQNEAIPAIAEMTANGMLVDTDAWMRIVDSNEAKHRLNIAELDTYFVPVVGSKTRPLVDLPSLEYVWKSTTDKELRAERRKEHDEAAKLLRTFDRESKKWEGEAAINYGSPTQMLRTLQKMGFKVHATDEDALTRYIDEPAIKAVLAYRETSKALGTYGRSYLYYIDPHTGRIHSNISQMGAETNRTSSTKPNSQNIPEENRRCFVARPGHVLITADMSQAELRIIAELSGDQVWIDAFKNDWDVHSIVAEMMLGKVWADATESGCAYAAEHKKCGCKGHRKFRTFCKTINFGVAYGMEAGMLAKKLGTSKSEASDLLAMWRQRNSVIQSYLGDSGLAGVTKLAVRTFSGFRRQFQKVDWNRAKYVTRKRFEDDDLDPSTITDEDIKRTMRGLMGAVERESKNTPIQGGNAEIAKIAMGAGSDRGGDPYMWHLLPNYDARLINFVHDEFVIECPEEEAQPCKAMIADCIRRAGAEFMTKVVMESEANISVRWEK